MLVVDGNARWAELLNQSSNEIEDCFFIGFAEKSSKFGSKQLFLYQYHRRTKTEYNKYLKQERRCKGREDEMTIRMIPLGASSSSMHLIAVLAVERHYNIICEQYFRKKLMTTNLVEEQIITGLYTSMECLLESKREHHQSGTAY